MRSIHIFAAALSFVVAGTATAQQPSQPPPLKLDPKGWQQLAKEVKRLFERAQRIEADAGERLKRGAPREQKPIDVGLVTMMFEAIALGEAIDGADRRHRRRGSRSAATADVS